MTPSDRLNAARSAAREGRHEEALQEYIWFHHHALAEQPALSGVRLSFALGYWVDLGADYPPALRALETIRDAYMACLLRGDGGLSEFLDVASINEYLGATALTCELYKRISGTLPELANRCAEAALPSIVEAEDFTLALQLLPDPEPWTQSLATWLNDQMRHIKTLPFSQAPRRWATIANSGQELKRVLNILTANGLHAKAARIRSLALRLIQSPSVRRDLAGELVRPSRAPIHLAYKRRRRSSTR